MEFWPKIRFLSFVLLVSQVLFACSHQTTIHPDNPDKLTDQFVYLALGIEPMLRDMSAPKEHVTKWTKPLRIRMFAAENVNSTALAEEIDTFSEPFVKLLARLNLDFEIVEDDSWNFAYFFYSDEEDFLEISDAFKDRNDNDRFDNLIQVLDLIHASPILKTGRGCVVNSYSSSGETDQTTFGSNTYALIFLPTYGPDALRKACFMEESVQALGVINDYGSKRPHYTTILDDANDGFQLTPADTYVLEALYDDRVKPGMNEQELRKILPGIFEELLDRG